MIPRAGGVAGPSEPHGSPAPHDAPWAQAGARPKALQGPNPAVSSDRMVQIRPCPQTARPRPGHVVRMAQARPCPRDGPGPAVSSDSRAQESVPAHLPCGSRLGPAAYLLCTPLLGRPLMIRVTSAGVSSSGAQPLMGTLCPVDRGHRSCRAPPLRPGATGGCPGPSLGPQDKVDGRHQAPLAVVDWAPAA